MKSISSKQLSEKLRSAIMIVENMACVEQRSTRRRPLISSTITKDSTMHIPSEHRKRRNRGVSSLPALFQLTFVLLSSSNIANGRKQNDHHSHHHRRKLHHQTIDFAKVQSDPVCIERERWLRQSPGISRILDDENNGNGYDDAYQYQNDDANDDGDDAYGDDYANVADDANAADDAAAAGK